MADKRFRFGPIALTTTLTTNILNPGSCTGGTNSGSSGLIIVLQHIHIANKTTSAATFSLWLGASGANTAGTEFWGTAVIVTANNNTSNLPPYLDWIGLLPMTTSDFLVGGAGTATALTIEGEGWIGVAT